MRKAIVHHIRNSIAKRKAKYPDITLLGVCVDEQFLLMDGWLVDEVRLEPVSYTHLDVYKRQG